MGYGALYHTAHLEKLPEREDLTLVLVVASVTPTLLQEIERMGWTLTPLGGGYARIDGLMYTTYVVIILTQRHGISSARRWVVAG